MFSSFGPEQLSQSTSKCIVKILHECKPGAKRRSRSGHKLSLAVFTKDYCSEKNIETLKCLRFKPFCHINDWLFLKPLSINHL